MGGPPTLKEPKPKEQKKADAKAKLADLKVKQKASRPAAKVTIGSVVNDKFTFTKTEYDDATEAVEFAVKAFNKMHGKGLKEIIISVHK